MLNARQDQVAGGTRRQLESAVRDFEAAVDLARDAAARQHTDADTAQALQARETAEALRRVLIETQLVVTHALEQMAAGSYGLCEDCSRPIDAERLRGFLRRPGASTASGGNSTLREKMGIQPSTRSEPAELPKFDDRSRFDHDDVPRWRS